MKIWKKALHLADQTPDSRNRYVDLLRALSILAVVIGHWVIAAPYYSERTITLPHVLDLSPWTHWLTWLFQVMPIFFFVGGYSNFTAWEAAQRRGEVFSLWLSARLKRLLIPVLPLVLIWAFFSILGLYAGLPQSYIQVASRIAIVPTWFLAVYIMVALFMPIMYGTWQRYKLLSIAPLLFMAVVLDLGFFVYDWKTIAWLNYLTIWLSVHQLGFAWREGYLDKVSTMAMLAVGSIVLLYLCVSFGPYPLALVGVPGEEVSNTLPPKLPLLLLGLFQIGVCMSLAPLAKNWLANRSVWAIVIIINSMIMTIFLWHSTAMMVVIGSFFLTYPEVYEYVPGTGLWWFLRPFWLSVYVLATIPFIALFSRFERASKVKRHAPLILQIHGCLLSCGAIGYLAKNGFGNASRWTVDATALGLLIVGMALCGIFLREASDKSINRE